MATALAPVLQATIEKIVAKAPDSSTLAAETAAPADAHPKETPIGPRILWLVAELDHEIVLNATSWDGLEKQLAPLLESPRVKQLAYLFLRRFRKVQKGATTTSKQKIQFILDILKGN